MTVLSFPHTCVEVKVKCHLMFKQEGVIHYCVMFLLLLKIPTYSS